MIAFASSQPLQYLSFCLAEDQPGLLPTAELIEILKLSPHEIVAIAHMPPAVMGVFNWRGEILWLVDLALLLGFPPLYGPGRQLPAYTVMILQAQGVSLGLAVAKVEQMLWCDPEKVQSPSMPHISEDLVPYLRGCWLEQQTMFLVLDGAAIVAGLQQLPPD